MKISLRKLNCRRQKGAAAVELAIVLPILIILMTVPIFFGRYFWHYTVAHKAATDAARYLSTVSVREMRSSALSVTAANIARGIAAEEIADLSPGGDVPKIHIVCGGSGNAVADRPCDGYSSAAMPETVTVTVSMDFFDNLFGVVDTGFYGWLIQAEAKVRYVGR